MTTAQMNVRMERALKDGGDLGFSRAGYTPTQAVRALWGFAQRHAGDPAQLRKLVQHMEEEGSHAVARPIEHSDAADWASQARVELYKRIGVPVPIPFNAQVESDLGDALQRQVDEDRAALLEVYAERSRERGL